MIKKKSLNESTLLSIKKYQCLFEAKEKFADDDNREERVSFEIFFNNEDNEKVVLKNTTRFSFVKKFLNRVMEDPGKLRDMGADAILVDDDNGRHVYTAYLNDDDTWDVVQDNLDEFFNMYYQPAEYRDTLLNRIEYSLVTAPPNLRYNSPTLADAVFKVEKGLTLDTDLYGYHFDDDGNAIIHITLNKNQLDRPEMNPKLNERRIDRKKRMIMGVADHFGVECTPFGERAFSIVVPDQEKYYLED